VASVGIVISAFSFVLSYLALRHSAKTSRADYSFRLWQAFMDHEVYRAYQEIEWSNFHYPYDTETGFQDEDQEYRIDKLIEFFDEVAFQIDQKVIAKDQAQKWYYFGRRVFRDAGVLNYLEFLDGFVANHGVSEPHKVARKMFS